MSDIRLIALDMDGTLVNSMKVVAAQELEAVKRAVAAGVTVVPASGRTLHTLPSELLDIAELRYFISCNGARISDRLTGKVVYRRNICRSDMLRIMEEAKKYRCVREAALDDTLYLAAEDDEEELSFLPPHQHAFLRAMRTLTDDLDGMLQRAEDGAEKILIFFHDPAEARAFRQWLRENFEISISSSIDSNLEINAAGVSKGAALATLTEYLKLPISAVMACGDSENDLDMIKTAGLGVAMGNATDEIMAAADAVTLTNDEHGVAAAIYRYALS